MDDLLTRLADEADQCRHDGADDIARLLEEARAALAQAAPAVPAGWQPIETAPKDGTPFLAWYPKHRLNEDDETTDEVIGGACAMVACAQGQWEEPDWLDAHGAHYFEDWCFAEEPTHWMPLPAAPGAATRAAPAPEPQQAEAQDAARWRLVERDGMPPCDSETVYLGVNLNGYAACFNAIDSRGQMVMESAEEAVVLMSGLKWWMPVAIPEAGA